MRKIILLLLLGLSVLSALAGAFQDVKNGMKAYEKGDYIEALDNFRKAEIIDPESPVILQNIGLSTYRAADFEKAQEELEKAFIASDDPELKAEIQYNLGNAYFQADSLTKAIVHYQKSLELNPLNEDAKYNLELARAILKEFAEKEEQDQSCDQQQQQQQQQQQEQQEEQESEDEQEQKPQPSESEEQENEDEQEQQPQPEPGEMTPEEAERMLDALQEDEKDMQQDRMQQQRTGRGRGLPDW